MATATRIADGCGMRVATFNVNGIRAATRRGFAGWLAGRDCDIVALQEVRCPDELLPDVFGDYHVAYHAGTLPGRNGVALLTRQQPTAIRKGFGHRSDPEGRYVEVDLPGLRVASLYLPKGGVTDADEGERARYARKMAFMKSFRPYLGRARRAAAAEGREFLILGDYNIAHERADVRNWRANQRSSGFLPEEREWFGTILGPRTLVDVVRRLHPDVDGPYSWWTWRGHAFDRDVGWRLDYHLATPGLAARALAGVVDRADSYDARISDHAPVVVDYAW